MSDLKPCPFCGSDDILRETSLDNKPYWVCQECGSNSECWNTRAPLPTDTLAEGMAMKPYRTADEEWHSNASYEKLKALAEDMAKALEAVLPSAAMMEMLWKDLPDSATGQTIFKLGELRNARAALAAFKAGKGTEG